MAFLVTLLVPSGVSQVAAPGGPYIPATDGTIQVAPQNVPTLLAAGCQYVLQNCDLIYIQAPAAADLVSIVAAVLPVSGTPFTIVTHPDVPRKLQVRGVYSGAVANLVVNIVGIDGRGNAVTESVNMAAAATTTFQTANAYAKVTSATPVGTVTNVTTIGIGVSAALALITSPTFLNADLVVYKEAVSTSGATFVDEAVGTVDIVAGTIIPTTAPNGTTKSYKFWTAWTTVA
jgi:hypothetical protein